MAQSVKIREFLTNRTQITVVDGAKSDEYEVSSGVPHGTVLGSLLYLLVINDLPIVAIQSRIRLFADDAIMYLELKSIASPSQLQQDLNKLSQLCHIPFAD